MVSVGSWLLGVGVQASARRRRVRAAFRAAALRLEADRFRAAPFAWRDRAECEAARWPSRFRAPRVARDLLVEVDFPARREADAALRFVPDFAVAGG